MIQTHKPLLLISWGGESVAIAFAANTFGVEAKGAFVIFIIAFMLLMGRHVTDVWARREADEEIVNHLGAIYRLLREARDNGRQDPPDRREATHADA